jgi:hypothetical protein
MLDTAFSQAGKQASAWVVAPWNQPSYSLGLRFAFTACTYIQAHNTPKTSSTPVCLLAAPAGATHKHNQRHISTLCLLLTGHCGRYEVLIESGTPQ